MLTGVAEVHIAVEAMRLGALDYMVKPFVLKEMLGKVEAALAQASAIREEADKHEKLVHEAEIQQADLEQRAREIHGLNRILETHLNEREESADRWHTLTSDVHHLVEQLNELQSKVQTMDNMEEPSGYEVPHLVTPAEQAQEEGKWGLQASPGRGNIVMLPTGGGGRDGAA